MSWIRAYRLALHLLPTRLRRKHAPAMEALFEHELGQARTRGSLHGALAGAAGVWDVVRRGVYEQARPARIAAGERRDHRSGEGWSMGAPASQSITTSGGPHMPQLATGQLLRRHAASFAMAFVALTASLLAIFAMKQIPELRSQGAPPGTVAEMLLFAVPFIAALTIPMAVLVAVVREFTRLAAQGTLAAAQREQGGVRRLVVPVLAAAAGIAAMAFVVTAEIVPRANQRLAAVHAGAATARNDRTMTISELRAAARSLRGGSGPVVLASEASFQVEIQKKLALPAACIVLALAGMAIALRVPRRGAPLAIGASCAVFGTYYVLMITGENLAHRLVVSPFVGMWGANALLLAASLLAVWRRRTPLIPISSIEVA